MPQRTSYTFALSALALMAGPACAEIVTSLPAGLDAKVITFSAYDGVATATPYDSANMPVNVGASQAGINEDVLLSFDNIGGADPAYILGAVEQSLGTNGTWPHDKGYAGLTGGQGGSMTFTFSRDLNFVGGFLNFKPGDGNAGFAAFDVDGNLVEETSLDFNLGDSSLVGAGQFIGFRFDAARIRSITISNFFASIDDLTFGTAAGNSVPEPGSTGLVLASLGLLGLTARRRLS